MSGYQNETKRHFETRQLEKDMAEAARKGPEIVTRRDALLDRISRWLTFAILCVLVIWLCFVLDVF